MDFSLDFTRLFSAFIVLFAIVDPLGSIPIVMGIESKGTKISPLRITIISYFLMLAFFFAGDQLLALFGVNPESFSVAGAIILFIMALEMLLDVEIFKNNGPEGTGSIVPLAFPLFAGPAVFTALLTIRVQYSILEIILAITLNMICVFFVLYSTRTIKRLLKEAGIYILRKFFGLILMAIAIKIFSDNLSAIFAF
ncbi:MAG: MarC family protein [Paludibacteraceae bacterium]|nr:MarC family protein [Paludibacteraceae bacterium]